MTGARMRMPSLQLVSNALYTVGAFVVGEELVNCFLHGWVLLAFFVAFAIPSCMLCRGSAAGWGVCNFVAQCVLDLVVGVM